MAKVEVYVDSGIRPRRNKFLVRWLVNFVAILITSKVVSGIVIDGTLTAFAAAFILGVVNAWVRPLLVVISIPFTILTLGLFTFVVNALMLLLTAAVIPGFSIAGFWVAVLGAILISIFSSIISSVLD